jgi:sugar lactone lactonase YvrE
LASPWSIFIDDDRTIYIADNENSRIVEWKCNAIYGQIIAGGNGHGNQTNQLNRPSNVLIDQETNYLVIADWGNRRVIRWSRHIDSHGEIIIPNIDCCGLTMDRDGSLYVSDYKKNEVRRLKRGANGRGTLVAGGNGVGDQLNQLNSASLIFIDTNYSLYVADSDNHRVMKWMKDAKEGIIVAGGNGSGDSLRQLSNPQGVIVDELGQIYVADECNNRVMRWCKEAKEGTIVVGGNGCGQQSNQLNRPSSLSFDRQGNLYVADCNSNRIQKFHVE